MPEGVTLERGSGARHFIGLQVAATAETGRTAREDGGDKTDENAHTNGRIIEP